MTRLCLTLTRDTLKANLEDLRTYAPDMAELRLDLLSPAEQRKAVSLPSQSSVPLILTCRRREDGGAWTGSALEREKLLWELMEGGFAFVDLEEGEDSPLLAARAREQGLKILRSLHDFEGVPVNLDERLRNMARKGDLVKAALMCRGSADLLRIFETAAAWKENPPSGSPQLILLGMGPFGIPSRILAGKMGLYLTFCSPEGVEAAPGHLDINTLRSLYRAGELDRESKVFGIIGNPVLHSRSPEIHNPGFLRLGMNGVYLPFSVDDLPSFFKMAELLDIQGFSVTVPYKEEIRSFLTEESRDVRAIGACNTVLKGEGKSWQGFNTDIQGFLEPLKQILKEEASQENAPDGEPGLKNMKAALIGAGGAARAVAAALVKSGCALTIFNRNAHRAKALAEQFSCLWAPLDELVQNPKDPFDLVVQSTSCGMKPGEDPVPGYDFSGRELLYDIIYSPPETRLMERARAAGCRVLGGLPMLHAQGQAQFEGFARLYRKSAGFDKAKGAS